VPPASINHHATIAPDGQDVVEGADFSERITADRDQVGVGALSKTTFSTTEATCIGGHGLDRALSIAEAEDMTYTALSADVHRILAVERGWFADQYERWLIRVLSSLLAPR